MDTKRFMAVVLTGMLLGVAACTTPTEPVAEIPLPKADGSLRIAALDYQIGDLSDPAVLAKYARAEIVVVQCDQFWGRGSFEGRMAQLKAANPDMKVIGYFRSKVIRQGWGDLPREDQTYNRDLYDAAQPYLAHTTVGDTICDWPGVAVFDFTNPAARRAMLDVFVHYQRTSSNKFDGVYWDYFNPSLWIAPTVDAMNGEPDMDGDGVAHWDDPDELQAFQDGQDAWVAEMQAAMGRGFIQIANGSRALQDSVFAAKLDGMFYEIFPNVGFTGGARFAQALDPDRYNNLWAAHGWPRTTNGGPWLILSHAPPIGSYRTSDGTYEALNAGDFLRVMALLTGATSTYYDNSGAHLAGLPAVELDLGRPVGATYRNGDIYLRDFERGRVQLEMGTGAYPVPFDYHILQDGVVVQQVASTP